MERDGSLEMGRLGREVCGWCGGGGGLRLHAALFVLAATALALLNVARSPGDLWFWRPLAWWGVLLAAHAAVALGGVARTLGRLRSDDVPAGTAAAPVAARPRREPVAHGVGFDTGAGAEPGPASDADENGGTSSPPEDGPAFASWVRATDAWAANGRAEGPAASTARGMGRLRKRLPAPFRDGLARAGTLVVRGRASGAPVTRAEAAPPMPFAPPIDPAASGPPAASPTGRFRVSPPVADQGGDPIRTPDGLADAVPDNVAALWLPVHPPLAREAEWRPPTNGSAWGTDPSPPPTAAREAKRTADPPPASSANGRRPAPPNQDVVLSGPMPVDAADPQWAWLEAAASAWLARREANGDPPPPSLVGPNGANGSAPGHR